MIDELRDPHTKSELISIFKERNISEKFFQQFLSQYKICYDELYGDMKDYTNENLELDGSLKSSALFVLGLYIDAYFKEIDGGHSELWSHLVADSIEEDEMCYFEAFSHLKEIDPEHAQSEIVIHCNNLSNNEAFRRHYLFLFELGEGLDKPAEKAKRYAELYDYLIAKGKSEIYADKYADLGDGNGYHEVYLQEYAAAFEKAFNRNLGDDYAYSFALTLGGRIADVKINCNIDEDDEAKDFDFEIINALRKASEYILDHKLNCIERFCKIYEKTHLNTYFADEGWPQNCRRD